MTETEGGWELTHERQVLYWIAKFGEGYPSGNELLFEWSKERDEYITNPKLNFTMCVPGGIQEQFDRIRFYPKKIFPNVIGITNGKVKLGSGAFGAVSSDGDATAKSALFA